MTVQGQLLYMLETVAEAIGDDLRDRLVFVGGCTTALFITDPITLEDVRLTNDVDLIVDLAGCGVSVLCPPPSARHSDRFIGPR
ncbi:hypothetical protein ACFOMH_19700 [Paracoccus mangrovi]|uniref:Nucleotidyl transferase AbiEii toxin, Type IV TA system n=1 Tax=Paracoccus mangrovi TaxID=1715645 RepID=A0ABV7RA32_9RHOB